MVSEKIRNFAAQSVVMYDLEPFKIDLKSLKGEDATMDFKLDDGFFEAVEAPDIHRGKLNVTLNVHHGAGVYELDFHTTGTVTVSCDLCLDEMEQPIETDNRIVARLGENYSEDDDLVTVPEDEGILDTAWFVYEFIELAVPIRHVHAPGMCNPAMTELLKRYVVEEGQPSRRGEGEQAGAVDSRWEALKKLKDKN